MYFEMVQSRRLGGDCSSHQLLSLPDDDALLIWLPVSGGSTLGQNGNCHSQTTRFSTLRLWQCMEINEWFWGFALPKLTGQICYWCSWLLAFVVSSVESMFLVAYFMFVMFRIFLSSLVIGKCLPSDWGGRNLSTRLVTCSPRPCLLSCRVV